MESRFWGHIEAQDRNKEEIIRNIQTKSGGVQLPADFWFDLASPQHIYLGKLWEQAQALEPFHQNDLISSLGYKLEVI